MKITYKEIESGEVKELDLPVAEVMVTKAYNGIKLISDDGEEIAICNRDSGFEFVYNGEIWQAKENSIEKLGAVIEKVDVPEFGEPLTCPYCKSYEWSYWHSIGKMKCMDCGHTEA